MTRSLAVLVLVTMTGVAAGRPHRKIDISKLQLEQTVDDSRLCVAGRGEGDRDECAKKCTAGSALSCARLGAWYAGGGESSLINTKYQDLDKAAVAFETACKLHHAPACYRLYLTDIMRHAKSPRGDLRALCDGGYALACEALAKTERARVGMAINNITASPRVRLACPKGATGFRSIDVYPSALGTVRPKWRCGAIDPATNRFIADGPYVQFATEEDEEIYPGGVISERGTMKHSERDGVVEQFDERGLLRSSTKFHDGKQHGLEYVLTWDRSYNTLDYVQLTTWKLGKRGKSASERAD